jgi:hypothetical protein
MGGGLKRNRVALPKGHDRGGDEQHATEMVGAWSQQQREQMDQAFTERMARALRQRSAGSGDENA